MDDSTLTVVYTRVVTGTAVVFVSVVGCVDVTLAMMFVTLAGLCL